MNYLSCCNNSNICSAENLLTGKQSNRILIKRKLEANMFKTIYSTKVTQINVSETFFMFGSTGNPQKVK